MSTRTLCEKTKVEKAQKKIQTNKQTNKQSKKNKTIKNKTFFSLQINPRF